MNKKQKRSYLRKRQATALYKTTRHLLVFGSGFDLVERSHFMKSNFSGLLNPERGRVMRAWRIARARLRREGFV